MTSDDAEPDLPRGIALAWGIAANPQRGPKREMSVERIVEAAVELADAEGLGAVSMAAVAARLGYTPMSLYRYVTAKDDLILLMQEEATGLPPEPGDGDWRARLDQLYHAMVRLYVQHPWVLEIPISGAPTTPNNAAWLDAGLAATSATALSGSERLAVMLLVMGHARWCGSVLAAYAKTAREGGMTDAEITVAEDALFRRLVSADAYPALREAIDGGVFLSDADPFAFGLARILDGIASYLAAVADGRPDAPKPWVEPDDSAVRDDKRYREADRAVRSAEKALRDAQKLRRQELREAGERLARHRRSG